MKKLTIKEAAIEALKKNGAPLSIGEIYSTIQKDNLYPFNAKNPEAVLKTEIRKHCDGLALKTGKADKCFVLNKDGRYSIK
jgi:restriction system protein